MTASSEPPSGYDVECVQAVARAGLNFEFIWDGLHRAVLCRLTSAKYARLVVHATGDSENAALREACRLIAADEDVRVEPTLTNGQIVGALRSRVAKLQGRCAAMELLLEFKEVLLRDAKQSVFLAKRAESLNDE